MVRQYRGSSKSLAVILVLVGVLGALGIYMGLFFSSHSSWIGEQPSTANFVHRTLGLVSDMPHMTAELFYDGILDTVSIIGIYVFGKNFFRKEHEKFDEEHGIHHDHEETE